MLPLSAQMASILASSVRAPRVYIQAQVPVVTDPTIGSIDPAKLGSLFIMDQITSIRHITQLEIGADTIDVSLSNQDGRYSPLSKSASMGRYFYPGSLDNKLQVFLGLASGASESLLPKGVFISDAFNQISQAGKNDASIPGLDQFAMFRGQVYTQFPPRLYGKQSGSYYNPNYALKNPSGDLKTYTCDAVMWMQSASDSKLWGSDYVAVAVYSSAVGGGASPVPNSGTTAYTVNYNTGTITFSTAQGATDVISVDARPLAMAPELALKHLFVDFGSFDPNFIKFDSTGIVLPVMENARDRSLVEIAKEIVLCTAPRGIRWQLYFDENGYLIFTEGAIDGPPVKVLVDERDILRMSPEFSSRDIHNVVRANARASNDQQITAVAYDVQSISTFGQKPTYDVPSQLLSTVPGMDPGSGTAYMNGLVNSTLFETSQPIIQVEVEILPDYTLQAGDPVVAIEKKTGINHNFYIKQITSEISGSDPKMTLRLEQVRWVQDFMYGLQANVGVAQPANPTQINTQSGLISLVALANSGDPSATNLVYNGQPVLDSTFNPKIFNWDGSPLTININLATPPASTNTYIWRWMYIAEDAYINGAVATGDGTSTGVFSASGTNIVQIMWALFNSNRSVSMPYDVRNNVDSSRSRRYYWPLLRPSDWVTNDGVTAYTTAQSFSSTWSGGPGAVNPQIYGNLRVGLSDAQGNTSSGYVGQPLYPAGSPGASALGSPSTVKYGVDFGPNSNKTIYYGIKRKVTPAFLGILVANTAGAVQFKRIPFLLSI